MDWKSWVEESCSYQCSKRKCRAHDLRTWPLRFLWGCHYWWWMWTCQASSRPLPERSWSSEGIKGSHICIWGLHFCNALLRNNFSGYALDTLFYFIFCRRILFQGSKLELQLGCLSLVWLLEIQKIYWWKQNLHFWLRIMMMQNCGLLWKN